VHFGYKIAFLLLLGYHKEDPRMLDVPLFDLSDASAIADFIEEKFLK
jgi:hypothetical protein